ncbi:MAG: 50S ribosomal protein L29 [Candidatus Cloacimonetes bacterium]|nr:50S ribosomal protein L29 [Candidatus Cloacimonadota bacterium]
MKKKEYLAELRTKTNQELQTELAGKRKKLADLRIEHSLGKLKDVKSLTKTRKAIAQILTIMKEYKKTERLKD